MVRSRDVLLVDANVVIDYLAADISLLALASRHLGGVKVLGPVLDEVDGLDLRGCEQLGLGVVEPELDQLAEAANDRTSLSATDYLCLIVARTEGWTCVTNDGALRRQCEAQGVPLLWGLEVMTELVRRRQLEAEEAVRAARAIHRSNPFHIPESLVDRFSDRVRSLERGRRGG